MRIYLEIRPCAGGDESEILTEELSSVYLKYARKNSLKCDVINSGKTKVFLLDGDKGKIIPLLLEGGIHKFQRISKTGKKDKIHTSTISVAVLQTEPISQIMIENKDVKIDTFRSGGKGGQNVNKVETAVRVTHIPTGIVVVCENERSQYQNKLFAMEILYAKLKDIQGKNLSTKTNMKRSKQVGSGERAESRRIYNYIRDEVVDEISNKRCSVKDIMDKANIQLLA